MPKNQGAFSFTYIVVTPTAALGARVDDIKGFECHFIFGLSLRYVTLLFNRRLVNNPNWDKK